MEDFHFLVKFGLVLIYILKVHRKNSLCFFLRKNMFNSLLIFFFCEKLVHSQVLKDFSFENLETTSSTFLSKCSCEIHLLWIISIFTLYLTSGALSLVCVSFFFFSFCIRIWQALAIHRIAGKEEEIVIFLVFYFHPLTNSHLVHRDFNHFSTFFPRSICNNQTDSWWHLFSLEICILFEFLLMLISGSYWFCHFKVTLWGFELISNYYLYITKQMP